MPYSGPGALPAADNTRRQCKYPIYSELQAACAAGIINFGAEITGRGGTGGEGKGRVMPRVLRVVVIINIET